MVKGGWQMDSESDWGNARYVGRIPAGKRTCGSCYIYQVQVNRKIKFVEELKLPSDNLSFSFRIHRRYPDFLPSFALMM